MNTKRATYYNFFERNIFLILLSGIFLFTAAYVFFAFTISVSAAQREALEIDVRSVEARTNELEGVYFTLGKDITIARAYELGFEEPRKVTFAARKTFAVNFGNEN